MNALVIVELHPSCENSVGVAQVGEGILPADDAFDNAVIRCDVGVLLLQEPQALFPCSSAGVFPLYTPVLIEFTIRSPSTAIWGASGNYAQSDHLITGQLVDSR